MTRDIVCPFCGRSCTVGMAAATGADESYAAKALMHHLRLKHARHDVQTTGQISVSTILSSQDKQGRIEFSLNEEIAQFDLDKAREVHRMLGEAIEAAVSDTVLYAFLTQKVGLAESQAMRALIDFRELRQGSREAVNPS